MLSQSSRETHLRQQEGKWDTVEASAQNLAMAPHCKNQSPYSCPKRHSVICSPLCLSDLISISLLSLTPFRDTGLLAEVLTCSCLRTFAQALLEALFPHEG